jgi:hypothetical protein
MAQIRRFHQVDFSTVDVISVTPDLTTELGGGYRCVRGEFVSFWKKGRIRREIEADLCRCWALCYDGYLAAYITLMTDKLTLQYERLTEENIHRTYASKKITPLWGLNE